MKHANRLVALCTKFYSAPLPKPKIPVQKQLGPFVDGYIHALLTTGEMDDPDNWGEKLELGTLNFERRDLASNALIQCMSDCLHFYQRNRWDLDQIWEDEPDYGEWETGWDFWVSRNGGEGFSIRGFELVWDRLETSAQSAFGKVQLCFDSDENLSICWDT